MPLKSSRHLPAIIFSEVFFHNWKGEEIKQEKPTRWEYFREAKWTTKFTMAMQVMDLITDILFANDSFTRDGYLCIATISAISAVTSTIAVIICWYLPFQAR